MCCNNWRGITPIHFHKIWKAPREYVLTQRTRLGITVVSPYLFYGIIPNRHCSRMTNIVILNELHSTKNLKSLPWNLQPERKFLSLILRRVGKERELQPNHRESHRSYKVAQSQVGCDRGIAGTASELSGIPEANLTGCLHHMSPKMWKYRTCQIVISVVSIMWISANNQGYKNSWQKCLAYVIYLLVYACLGSKSFSSWYHPAYLHCCLLTQPVLPSILQDHRSIFTLSR